ATSADLNAASNERIVNVEAVSAALAAGGVTIALGGQAEGFTITGSAQGDTIAGGQGADTINAGGGADTVFGAAGNDAVDAGDGDDTLTGEAGVDVLRGGAGNDTFHAVKFDGNDVYDGGDGIDTVDYSQATAGLKIDLTPENRAGQAIAGEPATFAALMAAGGYAESTPVGLASGTDVGADVLSSIENAIGGAGDDTIIGSAAVNDLKGGGGNDKIWARGDDDTLRGGDGGDTLVGGFGGNSGKASGNDAIYGEDGNDEIYGEDGNDNLWGGVGADQYAGGSGQDTLHFEGDRENDTAWGGTERDTFIFEKGFGVDTLKDFLATGSESDRIDLSAFAVAYKDLKIDQAGKNVEISGLGGGKIILEVVNAGALTAADFVFSHASKAKGSAKDDVLRGGAKNDALNGRGGKDKIKGNGGNDSLDGGAGNDKLYGGEGDDDLKGGGGADRLEGGPGADILAGGAQRDTFVFKLPGEGIDTITDFASGVDRLQISAAGFGGGLAPKATPTLVGLADIAGYVHAGNQGILLFDTSGNDAGTIYWDVNGGSSADAVAFARITGISLLATDFQIV
ncbi:MAG TPA: hypothetical protein VFK86_13230, partial [Bauldia sp.]|nr:hypothetical protein [Bauldia sp.]